MPKRTLKPYWPFFLLLLFLGSCAAQEDAADNRFAELVTARAGLGEASRADPGYMQYLERQSLLGSSAKLAQIVSGSNYLWRRPHSDPQPEALTARSSVWLLVNPQTLQTPSRASVLAHLTSPALWMSLNQAGITALYLAPTGGGGSLWDQDQSRSIGLNDDVIQYSFARNVGTEQEYLRIIERSTNHKILLGGDLLPIASGIGPDFLLAARNLREYPGLFCMIEVPRQLWSHLPALPSKGSELQLAPLSAEQSARLSQEGVFPLRLRQDSLSGLIKTGWAATGEVRGTDGNLRRWVYRYAYNHKRPILNFADPTGGARQVMSGSVIYQSGILGNSISGYSVSPLAGIEPDANQRAEPNSFTQSDSPDELASGIAGAIERAEAFLEEIFAQDESGADKTGPNETAPNETAQNKRSADRIQQADSNGLEAELSERADNGSLGDELALDGPEASLSESGQPEGEANGTNAPTPLPGAYQDGAEDISQPAAGPRRVPSLSVPLASGLADPSIFAPAREVSNFLSTQTRAYGSHAWLKDALPLPTLREAMRQGPDLAQDSVYSPAAEHALLTGDASLLNFMTDEALNYQLDWSRLVHTPIGPEGLDYSLHHLLYLINGPLSEDIQAVRMQQAGELYVNSLAQAAAKAGSLAAAESLLEDKRLYTTPAGLAALALSIESKEITPDKLKEIQRGHLLLTFFKAMQPGVLALSGPDVTGALPVELASGLVDASAPNQPELAARSLADQANSKALALLGSYPLLSSADIGIISNLGLPRAKTLYGTIDSQVYNPTSFYSELGRIIKLRERLGMAQGSVVWRFQANGSGLSALLIRLPQAQSGDSPAYALSVANFSQAAASETFALPALPGLASNPDLQARLMDGNLEWLSLRGNQLRFEAPGWSYGLILLQN